MQRGREGKKREAQNLKGTTGRKGHASRAGAGAVKVETVDGQIWGIYDDLAIGKNYIVVFNTLGDNILENDEIIIISKIL